MTPDPAPAGSPTDEAGLARSFGDPLLDDVVTYGGLTAKAASAHERGDVEAARDYSWQGFEILDRIIARRKATTPPANRRTGQARSKTTNADPTH